MPATQPRRKYYPIGGQGPVVLIEDVILSEGGIWQARRHRDRTPAPPAKGKARQLQTPNFFKEKRKVSLTKRKNRRFVPSGSKTIYLTAGLQLSHPGCLRSLGTLFLIEGYAITLLQAFETFALDGTEMNENIRTAINFDEPETLGIIKPFYSTFRHVPFPSCLFEFPTWCVLRSYFRTVLE